jgi:hypothetical protein
LIFKKIVIVFFVLLSFNCFALDQSKVSKGIASVNKAIITAKNNLNKEQVYSRAYPERLISKAFPNSIIHKLLVVENTSKSEITPQGLSCLYDHIGKNGFAKLSLKKSNKNAQGVMQITKNAFDYVRPLYKKAEIKNNFASAVKSPVTSAKVAMLFVDSALAALGPIERVKVMKNDLLFHDYIATAYNGGITYAMKLLRSDGNFIQGEKIETREYVAKMRLARITVLTQNS